ncbi:glycosyltransferase family 39 protein [Chryseobacterium sp. Leaf394]|uniref:glycosyltransferase family 39 protein n=1 Tax=Chryseobacterium sp. Leaf394 TaxID=1736361 RepID=UPI0006F60992|nr:glycosyltransferase family 39 protein [Chryseobacterium sp. Leaf394]KQS92522.1 hypothetical protein ASG21_08810 [Chryseobacterium sp. Leaf394]
MKSVYYFYFLLILVLFFLGCAYYYPFISDDSLISLRYAQRFIDGKGLSWNDGHPVEGYSNLLWVLLVSLFGKFNFDLILSSRILGVLCSIGTLSIIFDYLKNRFTEKEKIFIPLILLATTPCFAVWAIGGLEQPLYILLLTLVLTEVSKIIERDFKRLFFLALWLGLLAITRPDGFLFTLTTAGFLVLLNRKEKFKILRIILTVGLIPALFLTGQLLFRYSYYGEFVPNTALVKVKITLHHVLRGGFYNFKAFFGTFVLSAAGFYFLWLSVFKKKDLFAAFLLLNVIAWGAYITSVGGDIFPAYRQYYVVIILLIFATICGLKYISFKKLSNFWKFMLFFVLLLNGVLQHFIPANHSAIDERWEFRGMQLGENLKSAFPKHTLIAVTAAGCIPYSSQLPTVDMLGLNDYYIPRHPPANFGNGPLAHELGDANYVMKRNPDIIIFNTGNRAEDVQFNITQQLMKNSLFRKNYIESSVYDPNNQYILYLNKYSENTGIKRSDRKIVVPGYLFSGDQNSFSVFKNGDILKILEPFKTYYLILDDVDGANWVLELVNNGSNKDLGFTFTQDKRRLFIKIQPRKKIYLKSLVLDSGT